MKLYKLTAKNDQTMNKTQWGPGVTHQTDGSGDLCGPGWLHAYTDPKLAVLLNPIHANIAEPHLWLAEGEVEKDDRGLKVGTTKLTTINRMKLPVCTTVNRIAFGILCALEVCTEEGFVKWAKGWLDGTDRTATAAANAYAAAAAANATYAAINLISLAKKAFKVK